ANIQLAGSVRLTKRRNLYLVSGTLQAARGTYRLKVGPVSREFVVSQGTVRYFGTPDQDAALDIEAKHVVHLPAATLINPTGDLDRKSTRLNSSHLGISYAVFCLKKKSADSPRGATSAFPWVCRLLRLKSR